MTDQLPAAVLWDMDGTLVDTEPYWFDSQVELVEAHGGTWTRADGDALVGTSLWHSGEVIRQHGVDLPVEAVIDHLTTEVLRRVADDVPWRPGAKELLAELRAAGVPTALVTMSMRRMADFVVDALGPDAFDAVVAGDEVEHAKPHPEPYLRGAALLGVAAADCVAIEDSPPGLASAVAAGTVALGVEHHAVLLEGAGYQRRSTLVGVGLDELREIHAAGRAARGTAGADS